MKERLRKYLLNFASEHNLVSKEDSIGNILIIKPASPGMEKRKTLVLQSHMDMVGEKNADYPHNWSTDPIIPYIDGEWVTAKGTTLGCRRRYRTGFPAGTPFRFQPENRENRMPVYS